MLLNPNFMPLRRGLVALVTFCVLMVALIIAIYLCDPYPRVDHATSKAMSEISVLQLGLTAYRHDKGKYPAGSPSEILTQLVGTDSTESYGYIDKVFLTRTDPWKTPYRLSFPPTGEAIVISAGPNKTFGDRDDIEVQKHRKPW